MSPSQHPRKLVRTTERTICAPQRLRNWSFTGNDWPVCWLLDLGTFRNRVRCHTHILWSDTNTHLGILGQLTHPLSVKKVSVSNHTNLICQDYNIRDCHEYMTMTIGFIPIKPLLGVSKCVFIAVFSPILGQLINLLILIDNNIHYPHISPHVDFQRYDCNVSFYVDCSAIVSVSSVNSGV